VYLDWAQYPVTETEELQSAQGGYIVHFRDLRYMQIPEAIGGGRRRNVLGAAVELDKSLKVIGDVFGPPDNQIVLPEPGQH
jgi:hypothetical protein